MRPKVLAWLLATLLLVACSDGSSVPPMEEAVPHRPSQPDAGPLQLTPIVSELVSLTSIKHAGDGSGRLFLVDRPGQIRILKDDRLVAEPFLDIRHLVEDGFVEQGLLDVAFHPRFAETGTFFVNYTAAGTGDTHVVRYRVSPAKPDQADRDSGETILVVEQPFDNHNGGQIRFGPDGYLYIAMGDGGGAGDPEDNAQNLDTLLGAVLRIDVDADEPYAIPPDNPFVMRPGRDEIWAYGLRNPWRFSFDVKTEDLYIADVGQDRREEINFQPAGARGGQNYGWPIWEGTLRFRPRAVEDPVFPVAEYSSEEDTANCAVIGGYVYRGRALPGLVGTYLYGDHCSGRIWGLSRENGEWATRLLIESGLPITTFGEDETGAIYVGDLNGTLYRLAAGEG